MKISDAVERLKRNEASLKARGVCSLAIFGSTAREEARPDSDVDVLIEIDRARRMTLLDLSDIKFYISDVLGTRVDLAIRNSLRPGYRSAIEREAIPVF